MSHFVGAGPGAPDLITLRGAELLKKTDVIIYAGSLVNPALLQYAKPGCEVYNSAEMTLEEVIDVMKDAEAKNLDTVRLHTGDASLYGAIREQMDLLDELEIGRIQLQRCRCGTECRIHPAGRQPERGHHKDGRTDSGTGEGKHPVLRGARLYHGDLPLHRTAGRGQPGVDGGRL